MTPSIFEYVQAEENAFQTEQIQLGVNWSWSFRDHVQLLFHLTNSQFYTGSNNWLRAFKQVMEPIISLSKWAEDIEVKDIDFFIENEQGRVLSFLVRKYYQERYVKEHDLDTLIDEITESDLTYGGVLVQKSDTPKPEVMPLNSISFCDQTDILGGPIAFKHSFSPDKLRGMAEYGWGEEANGATISISELITLAQHSKDPAQMQDSGKNRTTGKSIEVYILKGCLPEHYMLDNDNFDNYYDQVQILAFYHDKDNKRQGVCLYRKPEDEATLKFHTTKKVYGRALGRGDGEALLHPQIWTNFLTIHKTSMLEGGAKTPLMTDDTNFSNRNKIQEMENNEIVVISPDTKLPPTPIQTVNPANVQLYEKSINEWFDQAQLTGSAFDPLLGKEPVSGTTFRGQERTVQQGKGLHEHRKGKRAKFIEEIYRDWIIPQLVREITKGSEFLASLTADEMSWVSDQLAENYARRKQVDDILELKIPQDTEILKQEFVKRFSKKGNKHLLKILKDEFKDVEVKMGINVAGKQKDLVGLSDKVLSIFQFIFANPQGFQTAMQLPGMSKAFQDIMEYSGVNSVDFATISSMPPLPMPAVPGAAPAPLVPPQPVA